MTQQSRSTNITCFLIGMIFFSVILVKPVFAEFKYKKIDSEDAKPSSEFTFKANGNYIDVPQITRGLNKGSLATERAGRAFLDSYGKIGISNNVVNADNAIEFLGRETKSSARSLKVKGGLTDKILTSAYKQTGRPFSQEGQRPEHGFSPAGFVKWVYDQHGVKLTSNINDQISKGRAITKEELKPGDLVAYRFGNTYHVGIFTGNGNFIHSSASNKVITETAAFGPEFGPHFLSGIRYFEDPFANPLSDSQKIAATNTAVKHALAELSPADKPIRHVASPKKNKPKPSKPSYKAQTNKKNKHVTSKPSANSRNKTARRR